ncbi:class I SAM-dependent methyltransferase [Nostoc sp. UHCC 0702]|nr:class I SAM-dependent methyltransferase [Nostoc sp. UHCC 0702]
MNNPICLCGATKFDLLLKGEYSFIKRDGKSVYFEALKCLNCQLVVTNPPPDTNININTTNNSLPPIFSKPQEVYRYNYANYRLHRLKPYLTPVTKNLEIGCSDGNLVEMVKQIGVKESIGVEVAKPIAELGKSLGRDIRIMYLEECNFSSNYFDIIQAHHVIEHIPNLHEVLDEIYRILKPNGIFYVNVPRHNSIFVRSSPNWEGWYPQEHFWHFTEKTLVNLLSEHKFQLVNLSCITARNYYTENIQQDKLYRLKKIGKDLIKKFNLGDTLDVLFLKVPKV